MPLNSVSALGGQDQDQAAPQLRLQRGGRRDQAQYLVYTGPIDYFFDHRFGRLPYRSLDFEFVHLSQERFQNAAVVNYPDDRPFTRITESKHFYRQLHQGTTICYEYPRDTGDPYYPIPRREYGELYGRYRELARGLRTTFFVGRLAEYRYMNMDQVVRRGLDVFDSIREEVER